MRLLALPTICLALGLLPLRSAVPDAVNLPEYTKDNRLVFPSHYREWIFLSSGLGMFYGPAENLRADRTQVFDNVFVTPAAYRSFLQTGKWPDKTVLVLEARDSKSKGSINNAGHYQSDSFRVEVEVKDSSRFPGNGWAFFSFDQSKPAQMIPASATCYSCHPSKGAVDNTFVQFYPTLLPIARARGTLSPAYEAAEKQ